MKEEVPNRPDDISVEVWELAYDTNHALWAVCDDDPDDVKFWQDTKVIAHALLQARSQAFEEAIRIAEEYAGQASAAQKAAFDSGRDDAGNMFWTGQTAALTISQAIRQHSQKGRVL